MSTYNYTKPVHWHNQSTWWVLCWVLSPGLWRLSPTNHDVFVQLWRNIIFLFSWKRKLSRVFKKADQPFSNLLTKLLKGGFAFYKHRSYFYKRFFVRLQKGGVRIRLLVICEQLTKRQIRARWCGFAFIKHPVKSG